MKTTHAVVNVYNLLCVFISQYSNKVDFISMGEAQMRAKGRQSQTGGHSPGDHGHSLPIIPLEPPRI